MSDDYEMIGVLTRSDLNAEVKKLESLSHRVYGANLTSLAYYLKGAMEMLDFVVVHRSTPPSSILKMLIEQVEQAEGAS